MKWKLKGNENFGKKKEQNNDKFLRKYLLKKKTSQKRQWETSFVLEITISPYSSSFCHDKNI